MNQRFFRIAIGLAGIAFVGCAGSPALMPNSRDLPARDQADRGLMASNSVDICHVQGNGKFNPHHRRG